IFQRVIAKIGMDERIDRERSVRSDEQRVTVRCRMRDEFGADAAAATTAVLDHHRLAERLADQIARYASDNVGIATGAAPTAAMNVRRPMGITVLLVGAVRLLDPPAGPRAIFFIIFTPISLAFNPR